MNSFYPQTQQMNMQQKLGMANFPQTFVTPTPLINRPDFTNRNEVLHNNVGERLLSEHIVEYKIHLYSGDRNRSRFPSPFKFKVPFGYEMINRDGASFPFNSDMSIKQKFKYIKYITLDNIVLPRTIAIDVTHVADPNLYPTSSEYSSSAVASNSKLTTLSNRKYLILKVDELNSFKIMGTDNLLDQDTFPIYTKTILGMDGMLWEPIHNYRVVYQNSLLHNLSSLTLNLLDESGNELHLVDQVGNSIIGTDITGTTTDYNEFISANSSIDSVIYTDNVTQALYNFTIGVVESEMNTNNMY